VAHGRPKGKKNSQKKKKGIAKKREEELCANRGKCVKGGAKKKVAFRRPFSGEAAEYLTECAPWVDA